ncbi:MAG: hypothetical protein R3F54_23470 [Alphaproteobacteria bacterium]
MEKEWVADGAVSLLPRPTRYVNPLYQFWRRHRDLFDDANCLWVQVESVPGLCQRFIDYVSTDLHWVTRVGAAPIAFDALAAGLLSYRASREEQFKKMPFTTSINAYVAFVNTALDQAAARLSLVTLSSGDAIWSPATGVPLQPWLDVRCSAVCVRQRPFDPAVEERARTALRDYVLSRSDRRIFGLG